MNKFRVNLHSALFDIETGGDTADVKEKQSEQGNTSEEYKPQGVSSTIQEAEENSKDQDKKDLKQLEQVLGIGDTPEIGLNDIETIKNFDYNGLFDLENLKDLKFKDGIEKKDEKGTYIEVNGKKIYRADYYDSNGKDGIYYDILRSDDGEPLFIVGQLSNDSRGKNVYIVPSYNRTSGWGLDITLPE